MNPARLVLPAVRWSAEQGFHREWDAIERAVELGVGGFLVFGGEAGAVRDLTDEMRRRAPHPLLIASDLERGAGQQFRGATPLPPAAALGALAEPETVRRAGEVTAREARALGIGWVMAPVADVDLEAGNPIVGTRAFGSEAARVAAQVAEWVGGCRDGGALACAKHYPGHGRTVTDSHAERPVVSADRAELEADLLPFRAAVDAGVDGVMAAHVAYPALDSSGASASLSPSILDGLRRELGFEGLVVTDGMVMAGFLQAMDEPAASVLAVAAGCDLLLYPDDVAAVVGGLDAAIRDGRISPGRVSSAIGRLDAAVARLAGTPGSAQWGREDDREWALQTAIRTLRVVRGHPALPAGPVRLVEIDDDVGGPFPPHSRAALPAALQRAGVELRADGAPVVALYADIRAWKGRPGLSATACERVRRLVVDSPDATILLFGHPRLAAEIPAARHLLAAWGGEALMQEAAASWLMAE